MLNNSNINHWLCAKLDHLLERHDEVQQRPQLFQRVLQWCACDQDAMVGVKFFQGAIQQRVIILQPVSFIHSKERPGNIAQESLQKQKHNKVAQQAYMCEISVYILALNTFIH